jgi:hypothetical protein
MKDLAPPDEATATCCVTLPLLSLGWCAIKPALPANRAVPIALLVAWARLVNGIPYLVFVIPQPADCDWNL